MSYSWSRNCFCPSTLWTRVHRESLLCPQFVSSFAKRFPAQKCQSCHSIEAAARKGNGRFCPSKTICRRIGPLSLKAFLACIFFTRLCRISSSLKLSGTFHSLFASKAEGPLYMPSCGLQINWSPGWSTHPYPTIFWVPKKWLFSVSMKNWNVSTSKNNVLWSRNNFPIKHRF